MAALIRPFAEFVYLPHQEVGVQWMLERESPDAACCRGGILADDMGLGKTWQTIGLLLNAPVNATLLVLPPVLVQQWEEALTQAGVQWAGFKKNRWIGSREASVFLITYNRAQQNEVILHQRAWDRIVLDEGHYIRNKKTKCHQVLARVLAPCRWILSGTPVQNKAVDFKNLAAWLGCDITAGVKTLAASIMLRRNMTLLAAQLPPPPTHYRHDLPFESSDEQRIFSVLVGRLEDAVERNCPSAMILERYLRIQQFSSHPQIYYDAMRRKFGPTIFTRDDWENRSSKMAGFARLIADSKQPTLVFSHFRQEMDRIVACAEDHGYLTFTVGGGMTESVRRAQIEASRTAAAEGRPVVLVCQIVAANCGLNLQHLNRVIFYTQHWNPSVIDQAMTRSYRFGQLNAVSIHHLIIGARETMNIDHLMLQKHVEKRGIAKGIHPVLEFPFHPDFHVSADLEESAVGSGEAQEDPINV
jgi:SNF2 family DNA or RNA helicase